MIVTLGCCFFAEIDNSIPDLREPMVADEAEISPFVRPVVRLVHKPGIPDIGTFELTMRASERYKASP